MGNMLSAWRMVAILFVTIFFYGMDAKGQVPKLETVEECSDRFLVNWEAVDRKFACVGEAYVTSNAEEGFVLKEWFEIKFVEPSTQKSFHFVECRQIYGDGELADRWEKYLKRDQEYFRCAGDYLEKLEKVDVNGLTSTGEPVVGAVREMSMPQVFAFAVLTGSTIDANDNIEVVSKFFGDSKILDSQVVEGKGISGFFGRRLAGTEIVFDENSDWMPVFSRSVFRKTLKGELNRDSYAKVSHEARTKWEKIGENLRVPVSITNKVHRVNPVSDISINVELKAVWAVDGIEKEMFSEKSLSDFYADEGPIIKMRSNLRKRFEMIPLPAK